MAGVGWAGEFWEWEDISCNRLDGFIIGNTDNGTVSDGLMLVGGKTGGEKMITGTGVYRSFESWLVGFGAATFETFCGLAKNSSGVKSDVDMPGEMSGNTRLEL